MSHTSFGSDKFCTQTKIFYFVINIYKTFVRVPTVSSSETISCLRWEKVPATASTSHQPESTPRSEGGTALVGGVDRRGSRNPFRQNNSRDVKNECRRVGNPLSFLLLNPKRNKWKCLGLSRGKARQIPSLLRRLFVSTLSSFYKGLGRQLYRTKEDSGSPEIFTSLFTLL